MAGNTQQPAKIIMWSTPRALSTALAKCLSYVPDAVIWNEPYIGAMWYGQDRRFSPPGETGGWEGGHEDDMETKAEAIQLPEGVGYDEALSSYRWCKEQLEADYPGKSLVFVKGMSFAISTRFDAIPDGYRHSFLIRHPMKVLPSWKKLMNRSSGMDGKDVKLNEVPASAVPPGYFFKESYDLLQHIKEHYEPNPIIIDADDLLNNPSGMLKAYCQAVGIPYTDDLPCWKSGDAIAQTWKIPRKLLKVNKIMGFYDNAFSCTQFNKPGRMPSRTDLTEDELYCVDSIMPYYEEMYAQRMTC